MPCRINRRRMWSARLCIEAGLHEHSVFATLTIRDRRHFYVRVQPRELDPRHMQLFLKRLRHHYPPGAVRYYGVGEYGERTFRPHYHMALFGVSLAEQKVIEEAWELGHVHLGELNTTTAHYIAGYVTKKMTSPDDPRLCGRHPEFARMSLRPAIGKRAVGAIADGLMREGGSKALVGAGDVPHEVRIEGRKYPMGRYLRTQLREAVGWEPGAPEEVLRRLKIAQALESDDVVRARGEKRELSELVAVGRNNLARSKRSL